MAHHQPHLELIRYSSALRLRQPTAIAIGNFDGVHLGHQALLKLLKKGGEARGLKNIIACTFVPLPEQHFCRPIKQLVDLRTKLRLLADYGVHKVLLIHFNHNFSCLSPQAFIHQILIKQLKTAYLVTGRDFKFGHKRQGSIVNLQSAQKEGLFDYETLADCTREEERISSSLVRQSLCQYQLSRVADYLGTPYTLYARIIQGQGIGLTKLNTATANLNLKDFIPCIKGVFACRAFINDGVYEAVTNLGTRPTVNGRQFSAETHLFNFDQDIRGMELKLQFIAHLRAEKKFNSLQELAEQIQQDKQHAKRLLSQTKPSQTKPSQTKPSQTKSS